MTKNKKALSVDESLACKVSAAIEENRPIWRRDLTAAEFKKAKRLGLVEAGVIWDEAMRSVFKAQAPLRIGR